jgi:hypothetical protein
MPSTSSPPAPAQCTTSVEWTFFPLKPGLRLVSIEGPSIAAPFRTAWYHWVGRLAVERSYTRVRPSGPRAQSKMLAACSPVSSCRVQPPPERV